MDVKQKIEELINGTFKADESGMNDLKALRRDYPYFAALQLLYLQHYKEQQPESYARELTALSCYISDAGRFTMLVNHEHLVEPTLLRASEFRGKAGRKAMQENIARTIEEEKERSNEKAHIDDLVKPSVESVVNPAFKLGGTEVLIMGDPIEHDDSFPPPIEQLKVSDGANLLELDEQKKKSRIKEKNNELIEKFIKQAPSEKITIDPAKFTNEDLSEKSSRENESFLTETLAQIYLKQGFVQKAIDVYTKLSLKYPEKSAYFASKITELNNK